MEGSVRLPPLKLKIANRITAFLSWNYYLLTMGWAIDSRMLYVM